MAKVAIIVKDFIGIYDDVFSEKFCDGVIEDFDRAIDQGFGWSRQDTESVGKRVKNDHGYWSSETDIASIRAKLGQQFNEVFWDRCYKEYAEEFDVLNDLGKHTLYGNKIQKTKVGEGYHVWHCEQGTAHTARRILFYVVYLNDVEEGGETEFLYQHKRVKPTRGTVVIAPAAFTHTHRGNPPLSNDKYILTGWIEF